MTTISCRCGINRLKPHNRSSIKDHTGSMKGNSVGQLCRCEISTNKSDSIIEVRMVDVEQN